MVPAARSHLEKFQASASPGVDGGYPGLSRCSQHLKVRPARSVAPEVVTVLGELCPAAVAPVAAIAYHGRLSWDVPDAKHGHHCEDSRTSLAAVARRGFAKYSKK